MKLEPAVFVRTAHTFDQEEYAKAWWPGVLLVQLEEPDGMVATALRRSLIGVVHGAAAAQAGARTVALNPVVTAPPPAKVAPPVGRAQPQLAKQVRTRLNAHLHFAVPLQKRLDKAHAQDNRFNIGRGRDSYVLLASDSVSKVHATLVHHPDGRFELFDNGSRNGTVVNGTPLARKASVPLQFGDVLRVGTIEIMFCPLDALWFALQSYD